MDDDQMGDAAAAATSVGQVHHPGHLNGEDVIQLAHDTCHAIEQGDISKLFYILNIFVKDGGGTGEDGNESSNQKCRQVLAVFYSLIGCGKCSISRLSIPLSVKAHLLLRALLRLPLDKYMIPWEAANAAIQSLQYSNNNHEKSLLSHGEEVAMVAEIRSFVIYIKAGSFEKIILRQTIEQLRILSDSIIAPLQLNRKLNQPGDYGLRSQRRRHNSFLLPLDLIPTIIASMDALDDVDTFAEKKNGAMIKDTVISIDDNEHKLGTVDTGEEGMMYIRASDNILSSMFASYIQESSCDGSSINFDRTIRADAVLPLLSLAMDDLGFGRMSITREGVTYWDRLKFAICDVLRSNFICYSLHDEAINTMARVSSQQIVNEALSDEGIHIIPTSDYPALARCIFRMVSTSSSAYESPSLSWEAVFLRLYHAAAIATIETPLASVQSRKHTGGVDRQALLPTIESHVLLPLCTGASVRTIKSILDACTQECCQYCKEDCANREIYGFGFQKNYFQVLPAWAVARVVLFIICARASNLSHLATSTIFGPRVVFRMASDLLLKAQQTIPESKIRRKDFGSDEVGYALQVLLNLSAVREGICRVCRDDEFSDTLEKTAYDVLKYSYYADKDHFSHRYKGIENEKKSYQHKIGLRTISLYCNLVRSSLGTLHNDEKIQSFKELFQADTARTWIDAANMLLDENFCSPSSGKAPSSIPDGTPMAVVIIVVVFFEVPSSQNDIVRSIYDRLTNMTSYHSHGALRKREQSYFLLISILAWSLAARDGKHSYDDVVRSKRGEILRGNETTVLQPLCNLLSKSALSSEQHLNDDSNKVPHLSYWALRMLARALAPNPSGRGVILAMAQKNISTSSPLHPQPNESLLLEALPKSSASIDSLYLAVDCLCALIEKFHPSSDSSTDDCGQRALVMLTDLMKLWHPLSSVSSYTPPPVSINIASWMISELNKAARLRKLTKWVSRRLLRACYGGLLKFTALEESESGDVSSCFVPELIFSASYSSYTSKSKAAVLPASNYVYGMLRFAVGLYNEIAMFDADMVPLLLESHTLLKHIIRTLLNGTDQDIEPILEDVRAQNSIDQLFRKGYDALRRGFKPCDELTSFAVDGVVLIIVIQGAAGMIHKKRRPSPERVDTDAFRCLNEYIFDAERYYLPPLQIFFEDHPSSIEVSKRYQGKSSVQSDETLQDCVEFKVSVCDIMTEILLRGASVHLHDASVLLAVNSLLGFKRRADPANVFGNMSYNSICNLLELSSRHLRLLLGTIENKKDLLPEVEMLVLNVLDFCNISAQGKTAHGDIINSLWSLYCALADEESARLLISYIKESYLEIGNWASLGANSAISESSISLLSITSSKDIDMYARNVRETILSAISQVLAFIASSQNMSSLEERRAHLDLLLQILLQLCQDLDSSFGGYSGGIQSRLFLSFLGAIDKCVDAMVALFESMPTITQHQIGVSFASVHQASVIIWEIFCENTLRQASPIKSALRVCIDKIPSMILKVERVIDKCIVRKSPSEHVCEILRQCGTQLMSKPINKAVEAEIDIISAKMPSPSYLVDTKGGEARDRHVHMPNVTSKTLMWVYNFALGAITNIWNDSYRIISGSGKMKRHMVKNSHPEKISALALRRIVDFSRLHTSICCLFGVRIRPKDETDKGANANPGELTNIPAELFSFQQKIKLCSCVEKMSMALTLALKRVIKYFQEFTPPMIKQKPFNESKLNESLICILGWLHSVNVMETEFDLITGFLRWRANERRIFSLSPVEIDEDDGDGYAILGHLPKVLLRLEGLEAELRKLNAILADRNGRNDNISIKKRLILDRAASALMDGTNAFEELCDFGGMIRRCIEIVELGKKSIGLDDVLLSDEDESDDDPEGDNFSQLTGKRRSRQRFSYSLRKSRKVSLRSRNETVDSWLAMDDDEFGSARREKSTMPTMPSLISRDFIVEG
ncbi:hypothetical protein ACHAW5_010843 [Stephanodiscus triporus]|uniref:Non-specific serine/threonine protein kinase n=1 Tax=Stephanodiscus triporus TaxID=2934178 RepID=A0ABD3NH30_9STRA